MLKKLEKEEEKKALDIISQCKTKEEAVERLQSYFGTDATLNMRCWRALTELPKRQAIKPAKTQKGVQEMKKEKEMKEMKGAETVQTIEELMAELAQARAELAQEAAAKAELAQALETLSATVKPIIFKAGVKRAYSEMAAIAAADKLIEKLKGV